MTKKRVYEIANELGIPSKLLMTKLAEMGVEVKNQLNAVDDAVMSLAIQAIKNDGKPRIAVGKNPDLPNTEKGREEFSQNLAPENSGQEKPKDTVKTVGVDKPAQTPRRKRKPGEFFFTPDDKAANQRGGTASYGQPLSGDLSSLRPGAPTAERQGKPEVQNLKPQSPSAKAAEPSKVVTAQPAARPNDSRSRSTENQNRTPPVVKDESAHRPAPGEALRAPHHAHNAGAQTTPAPALQNADKPRHRQPEVRRQPAEERSRQGNVPAGRAGEARDVKAPENNAARPAHEGERKGQNGDRAKPNGNFGGKAGRQAPAKGRGKKFDADLANVISHPAAVVSAKPQTGGRGKGAGKNKDRYEDYDFRFDREEPRRFTAAPKGKGKGQNKVKQTVVPSTMPEKDKKVAIGATIVVKDLAALLSKEVGEVIKKMMALGTLATINQEIDFDTAAIVAQEFGFNVERATTKEENLEELIFSETEDDPKDLVPRPPIVTVMGHVDHGKTSLLDAIRHTNVTASEAGGITQHIGASTVEVNGKKIVFLDTPGHEAFTAMRARGAKVTDIAVLVVAADDGVMPQTIEAINHAKAAQVPIIVAVNKMDRPNANPDRVVQQLAEHGLVAEEWGGDTIFVKVSAVKREGIDHLLEMILLVAEMQELKANPKRAARGIVIEAELDKGQGPVATVIVQNGTLQIGQTMIAGATYGRVRAMIDDKGRRVKKAGPSSAVRVIGLSEVPMAGDIFQVVEEDKVARQLADLRQIKKREEGRNASARLTLDDLFSQIQEGKVKELNIIAKADVQGTVDALRQSLQRLSNEEVRVNVIHGGVGGIVESDVMLASASNAIIIGFNVRPDSHALKMAEAEKVDIRTYRIIYEALNDVEAAMKGMLEPKFKEVTLGRAEVRATFKVSGVGTIAGCYVLDGKIIRQADVRVLRNNVVIFEGKLESLKRFKDDVREVSAGFECGIGIEKFNDIKEGDIIEAYIQEQVKQ